MIDFHPRPYQTLALEFLRHTHRANLYADPGLGKTTIVLSLIEERGLQDVLIVAPRLVVQEVWCKEPQKWRQFQHLHVQAISGTIEERERQCLALPRICAINFEQLIWLFLHFKDRWPFRNVIYDESPRLKGLRLTGSRKQVHHSTRRALAIAQYAHTHVERWINLTGTPNANGYLDLWGPQWFIDGGTSLGRTYGAYQQRWFCRPPHRKGFYGHLMLLPGAQADIQSRMRSTTFSIRAKDWFDLKTPIERTVWVELPPAAREPYRSMQRSFYADLKSGRITAANCGVKALKLRQLASGAVYRENGVDYDIVHTERLEAVRSIVAELSGAALLIVWQFRHELEQLKNRFKFAREVGQPGVIEAWNEGRVPQLLLHAKSAGHGLNLQQGGHHICFYTPYSDNELYRQVLERIGPTRQAQAGLDRCVSIHHIEARQTVDQVTRATREGRITELEAFLDAMSEENEAGSGGTVDAAEAAVGSVLAQRPRRVGFEPQPSRPDTVSEENPYECLV